MLYHIFLFKTTIVLQSSLFCNNAKNKDGITNRHASYTYLHGIHFNI